MTLTAEREWDWSRPGLTGAITPTPPLWMVERRWQQIPLGIVRMGEGRGGSPLPMADWGACLAESGGGSDEAGGVLSCMGVGGWQMPEESGPPCSPREKQGCEAR